MQEKTLIAKDKYILHLDIYENDNPLGYIQIIHGMQEHKSKYTSLAEFLCERGYTVIVSNIRGHGKDAPILNYFKDKDGYKYLLSDQEQITQYIFDTYQTDKVILLGHSMGTLIARNLLQTESNNYEKIILTGSPSPQRLTNLGLILTNIIKIIKGPKYYSRFIEKIIFHKLSKNIKNPKTNIDWLNYNEKSITECMSDKYSKKGFTVSAYNDLFHLLKNMTKINKCTNINYNLPILLLRGDSDPCTGTEQENNKTIKLLKKSGFNNIKDKKYQHMRHNILTEVEHEKVYQDIITFLNN